MAKEILAIPEESLPEVIAVIRQGLRYVNVSRATRWSLLEWCRAEEEYCKESLSGLDLSILDKYPECPRKEIV